MASRIEEKLKRLASAAQDLPSKPARDEFTKVLLGTNSVLISRAAKLVARARDRELLPALVESFRHLLQMPAADDKGCRAKNALLDALDELECDDVEPFAAGLAYQQIERMWDGMSVDTAADLRANCAFMLARRFYPDIHFAMARLLVDPEAAPRVAAVSVLGGLGTEAAELVLTVKALMPEEDPVVMHKCFAGLVSMGTDRSWRFVVERLRSGDPMLVESAAIALGETHNEDAFPILREAWETNMHPEIESTLALALALTRTDQAIDYLIGIMSGDNPGRAKRALEALSIYSSDDHLRERTREAVMACGNARLAEAYQAAFGT